MGATIIDTVKRLADSLDLAGKTCAPIRVHAAESTLLKGGGVTKAEDGHLYFGLHQIELLPTLRPRPKKAKEAA